MLTVRSCISLLFTRHCLSLPLRSSPLSRPLHLSLPIPTPRPVTMSARPNAFDALMSGARVASKKQKPQPMNSNSSSKSKPKPSDPKSQNPSSDSHILSIPKPDKRNTSPKKVSSPDRVPGIQMESSSPKPRSPRKRKSPDSISGNSDSTSPKSDAKQTAAAIVEGTKPGKRTSSPKKDSSPERVPRIQEESNSPKPRSPRKRKTPEPVSRNLDASPPKSDAKQIAAAIVERTKPGRRTASPKKDSSPERVPRIQEESSSPKPKSPRNRKSPEPTSGNPYSSSPKQIASSTVEGTKLEPAKAAKKESGKLDGKKKKGKTEEVNVDDRMENLKRDAAGFELRSTAWWEEGEKVPFLFIAKALGFIEETSGRRDITGILCNLLRTVVATTPDDLLPVVYLLAQKVAPAHEGLELGIGEASIIKAMAEAYGRKEEHIKKQYADMGDLGLVAKASRSSQKMMFQPAPLTVVRVSYIFLAIAKESGKDSQERKKNSIKSLLVAAKDTEPVYLIRLLQKKLRIGSGEKTLLAALGQAAVYAEKHSVSPSDMKSKLEEAAEIVKQVYSVLPVYDEIIPALLSNGVWDLPKNCTFKPGVPIGPMLAKPSTDASEIIKRFHNMVFTCEYKYDGERAQIHYMEDGSVEIYSRNAERNTGKFPDVIDVVKRLKKSAVSSFVLDGELVAYDREKQKILPFQVLSTRARKNVSLSEIKVNVCIFAFDMLYLNGKPLLQEQLSARRELLYASFEEQPGFFQFATAITSNDVEEILKFIDDAVNASCEGLIVKTLDREATYEPCKRSNNWLKLKKDYMKSFGDSVDLVPIGAFFGRGKRTGVYGAFLLACYDDDKEEFQSICKIGTGFSEAILEERSISLRSKLISSPKSYYHVGDTMNPDVWFEPSEVWEVKAADLTISPVHRAAIGIVDANKGVSLRFPRLVRIREDKQPEKATSSEQIAEMFYAQKNNHRKNQDEDEDDKEDD